MESKEKLIELHEIRIGNLLSYKGEFVHVTSLSRDIDDEYQDIIGFCKIGKNTDEKAGWNRELFNDLKRIPLTTEWLINFGFVDKGPHDDAKSTWGIERITCPAFDFYDGVFYCTNDWGAERFASCEYVHEFQNAFFVLTGEELTIKL